MVKDGSLVQPTVETRQPGAEAVCDRQVQRITRAQRQRHIDEHGGGSEIGRLDLDGAQLGRDEALEVCQRLLPRGTVDGASALLDAADAGHFGQRPRRDHQAFAMQGLQLVWLSLTML